MQRVSVNHNRYAESQKSSYNFFLNWNKRPRTIVFYRYKQKKGVSNVSRPHPNDQRVAAASPFVKTPAFDFHTPGTNLSSDLRSDGIRKTEDTHRTTQTLDTLEKSVGKNQE